MSESAAFALELSQALMSRPSVTPDDAGCQDLLARYLQQFGFNTQHIDAQDTRNLYAWKQFGHGGPHLMFAGHTDVVPTGPLEEWRHPPFSPTIENDLLYGRGAADMKSSLAAMVSAVNQITQSDEQLNGIVSFLVTSDEEGDATYGTQYAIEQLLEQSVKPDFCIVGEPSSTSSVGDVVRCGRRGSVNGQLTINGVQGHVAYPDQARNPIHLAMPALHALTSHIWDEGNEYYPPTSLQISNIQGGTGATNVIPGQLHVSFNLRFSTAQTIASIKQTVADVLTPFALDYQVDWQVSGLPFLTRRGRLTDAVTSAIHDVMGIEAELSTSGGTSDGRFIAPWHQTRNLDGAPHQVDVIELGPTNATIHKINENIPVQELSQLVAIYTQCMVKLLGP